MFCSHFTDAETLGKFIVKVTGLGREDTNLNSQAPKLGCAHPRASPAACASLPETMEASFFRQLVPCPQLPVSSLTSGFWDATTNAQIWTLQRSAFSSRSLGSSQEGSISKEGGNQNKVKSMASQLLAKFEESSRNPSLLKQVSPIMCSLAAFSVTRTEKTAEMFQLVMDFRYGSHAWLK